MKSRSLLIALTACLLLNAKSNAQFINNMSIYPVNPTTNDSVYLIASSYFQSGTCNQKTLNYSIINEYIDCDALHCVGMLTYICYDEDTFSVGKLPAGNYIYRYTVNAGFGFNPCTPGIVPGPTDSLSFTVTSTSGIDNHIFPELVVGPNPCSDFIEIKCYSNEEKQVSIIDMTGKICQSENLSGNHIRINTNNITSGLYILRVQSQSTIYQSKLFYKK
ncbi:MAG: hypothetical protein RLZZ94_1084 [Bacteroidota bacterium]